MINYDRHFTNTGEIHDFVLECEKNYENQIDFISGSIAGEGSVRFILLAGPSCSGKTTSAKILFENLASLGISSTVVSIDDFYRDRGNIDDDEKPDFESASALDLLCFERCAEEILEGKEVRLPKFDFVSGKRTEYVTHKLDKNEIIVFEGIQAMYPEITGKIPAESRKSISISVADDVCAYGQIFPRRNIRFMRRLVRDYQFRAAHPARTIELWKGVTENEDKNIIPNLKYADFTINSLLLYELNVIKPYVLNLIPYDAKSPDEVSLLERFTDEFRNVPEIPSSFVPANSVFREFIG